MTSDSAELIEKDRITDVVTRLFVATDARDWEGVQECLDDSVLLDMTSVAGGEPARLTPAQVAEGWKAGLRPIEHVHHQIGNLAIRIEGAHARAGCYGIAYHYRPTQLGRNTRVFVGSYDLELRADAGPRWRITTFRFNLKFVDGNRDLEKEP
jgi:hypothetical protein